MTTKKQTKYDSTSIETQRFPHNVRASPAMYIGGVDAYGLWTVTKELLDNGADEFMAQRNDAVFLHFDADGSYWVWDHGHGIPQGVKTFKLNLNGKVVTQKMPTMQAVFGELHTSGKYRSEAYAVSIGSHGVGSKGTNATAEYFDVWTLYEGRWSSIKFKKGELAQPVKECSAPKLPTGKPLKKGTLIHFKPDASIFSVKSFPPSMAVEWATVMSYMNPGLSIHLSSKKGAKTYLSKKGPQEYIEHRLAALKTEGERQMFVHHDDLSDVVLAFTNYDGCDIRGMTNSVTNGQGGKHVDSVTGAVYAGLKPWIKTKKVKEDGKVKVVPAFRETDLKEGLVGLVNAKLHKAQFSSQDKARLTDNRLGKDYEEAITKKFVAFFKENKALAQRLCDRATKLNELKTKFTMSKKAAATLNAVKRNGLPAKYAAFNSDTKVHDRELFLVEGDSAGGSLKDARLPYQAVLPLKGKVLNALKDNKGKALESDEIINILAAIGYDTKAADPLSKLTVGKIICLADPDPDGPFVADTQVRFRYKRTANDGQPQLATIECLAEMANTPGQEFEVPVYVNGKEQWAPATAQLERNVDTLVSMEIGGHKYKVSEDHKFLVIRTPSTRNREGLTFSEHLCFMRAADMNIGDRVYAPHMEQGRRDYNRQDKTSGHGFMAVNKLRVQKQSAPVPVYCLTVPRHHHFLLPSGVVSSNCHINSLLLGLFYKYLPDLFDKGMVYVSAAPEFYSIYKDQLVTGDTLSAVQVKLKKLKAPTSTAIHHLKGWGEASENLMRVLAADPATRRLIKIKAISHDDKVDFVKVMNEDVEYRRRMLGLPQNAKGDEDEAPPAAKKAPAKKAAQPKAIQMRARDGRPLRGKIIVKQPPVKKTGTRQRKEAA
ncbi:type IIA topoisomerase [Ralstonia phage phiRSL1]|uniref:DNA topoisomerase (ATP-hydrolyzing) n=1 Tax=Ralstonia phage phiRSL1 TaxID=1980924 RepID=B2ZYK3_9CAUD|nr:DNA topoisomerase II large subunit [Ralstonia phage phiRSL1]BAG41779.1 type IIA topoisomerase [Ralstonia phage phiRSL1]